MKPGRQARYKHTVQYKLKYMLYCNDTATTRSTMMVADCEELQASKSDATSEKKGNGNAKSETQKENKEEMGGGQPAPGQ